MQKHSNIMHRTVAIFGVMLMLALTSSPTPAYAVAGVADTNIVVGDVSVTHLMDLAKNTLTSVYSGITSGSTYSMNLKEYVLDGLANAAAKAAVQSVVHGVVNWANNGFNGSPAFVVNIQAQLGQISDVTASRFFSQLTGTSLGSPFQQQILSGLQSNYYKSTSKNSFFLLNKCTLTGNAASAVSTSGYDFSKGGLSGWLDFTSKPQNNPIGLSMAMQDELNARATAAITQSKDEMNQNHGFLSWRGDCKDQGVAPTSVDATAPVLSENPDGSYNVVSEGATTLKDNGTNCLEYDVETPGSVIEGQLQKTLGSGVDSLISADEINEIVSALATGLISNVLGGNGLRGVSKPQGGGADYFGQTTTDAASAGIASNLSSMITTQKTQIVQYQTSWQTIGAAANTAKTAVTSVANSVVTGALCKFGEGSSASDVLQNVVNPAVDQATVAAAKSATSLTTLSNIQNSISGTGSSTPTTDTLTSAALNYQQFLTASTTPSSTDLANAQAQSVDVSAAGAVSTSTPAGAVPLLTEMKNIAAEAKVCTTGSST